MFFVLHRKVGIVFTLSKTIISDFWTQSALTYTAVIQLVSNLISDKCVCRTAPAIPGLLKSNTLISGL